MRGAAVGIFGKKDDSGKGGVEALETYKVIYKGGLAALPKAKSGEIRFLLTREAFELQPTIGSKSYWQPLTIPYADVADVKIVARQMSTLEAVLGGPDARRLNDSNNIHIEYLDESNPTTLRLEMLTGITVPNQAAKCREFEDRLRTLRIRDQFRAAPAGPPAAGGADVPSQIAGLAQLRDQGIISDAEFETKKADLLSRM
ncbi:SHOCT domain-containing protein [Rugosimonospora africana]|uniref:SHOCT domain-containing protein n=1 Tax=Rugosimonospora africana TaxID=556532 RepID=A0A8J3QZT5_9ACTN|nr:SHOCT domain-containing protein [Rugosimonospora africana]GIH19923.1 hypothetical protein Raf01_80950 [Rugosimonospora africana]